jgi:hypothetical protein
MQLSQAKEIVNTPELNQNWQKLTQEEADLLMDHVESQQNRQECCFPYDCMHHEQCDGEYLCGSCKRGAERWKVVDKVLQKFPMGYQYAQALTRMGEQELIAHKLQTIKDLRAIGDHAAADRLFNEGDEDSW